MTSSSALVAVLEESRRRGFLGATVPIETHIAHARGFGAMVAVAPVRAVDLGSGGGLPGLVLAEVWPTTSWLLVDAQQKRTAFLQWAVDELGWADRVQVRHGRAEEVARDAAWRQRCDLVVARSFGPPAVVAECAAGFLQAGGLLVVSEPPVADPERWERPDAVAGLARLGQANAPTSDAPPPSDAANVAAFHRIVQVERCTERYPRRTGVPERKPLF